MLVPQVSSGDLLRDAVKCGTELGRRAKAAMDAGELVSDKIVLGMIRERLGRPDAAAGFILDGYPRNVVQAAALDALLAAGQPIDAVVLMDVDPAVLFKRLTGRRSCPSCGKVFNVYTAPSKNGNRCDNAIHAGADAPLLVQSGKPVGVFRTHADAPRVLIANSNLVVRWSTWGHFNELDRRGLMMYGQMTAGSWIYIGS